MIYLHKVLPMFVLPLGIALMLIFAGVRLRRTRLIIGGCVVLWLASMPLTARFAVRAAEGWSERRVASEAPHADAIVVLSEGRTIAPGKAAVSEWNDADRFFGGMELFNAGKAPLLVFTGGWEPWQPNAPLEGDVLAAFAKEMGVRDDQIACTGRVINTAEEATAVSALLAERLSRGTPRGGPPNVLLVTSAVHMARARQLFDRAGVTATPFPVDFRASADRSVSIPRLSANRRRSRTNGNGDSRVKAMVGCSIWSRDSSADYRFSVSRQA